MHYLPHFYFSFQLSLCFLFLGLSYVSTSLSLSLFLSLIQWSIGLTHNPVLILLPISVPFPLAGRPIYNLALWIAGICHLAM